jgi:hypothetical protein
MDQKQQQGAYNFYMKYMINVYLGGYVSPSTQFPKRIITLMIFGKENKL